MSQPEGYDGRGLIEQYRRMRRNGARLILLSLLIALVLVVIFGVIQRPPQPDTSRLGVHLLLDDGRNAWDESLWAEHLDYAAQMLPANGAVVQLIRSDDLDAEKWQTFIDLAQSRNLRPVLRLATTYDRMNNVWRVPVPDDDGGYGGFAQHYADFVSALDWEQPTVILLNEPNNGSEWGGAPDAAAYARLVADTVPVLRDAVPDIRIWNAALDLFAPNTGSDTIDGREHIDADTYLETIADTLPDYTSYFDAWNSHAYSDGFRAPPWEQRFHFDALPDVPLNPAQPPANIHNRGINGYEWELWKLESLGMQTLPVVITEVGWRHSDPMIANSVDAGEYLPPDEAASMLDMALRGNYGQYTGAPRTGWTPLLTDPRVTDVVVFALNGTPDEWSHTNLLRVTPDGEITGTYAHFDLLADLTE